MSRRIPNEPWRTTMPHAAATSVTAQNRNIRLKPVEDRRVTIEPMIPRLQNSILGHIRDRRRFHWLGLGRNWTHLGQVSAFFFGQVFALHQFRIVLGPTLAAGRSADFAERVAVVPCGHVLARREIAARL